ncbi:hypothetical protein D3C76_959920 [compost metagenome]
MNIERIVTGDRLRGIGFIVAQRTHAGVSPDHVIAPQLFLEVRVINFQQIADFTLVDFDVLRIAFVLHVGGADDRKFIHPRDHKHDALIFVLQDIGLLLRMHARHHDVAAFDQADTVRRRQFHAIVKELFHPRAGSVHQAACLPAKFLAVIDIFGFDNPQPVFTACSGGTGAGFDLAVFLHHHLRVRQYQARIVHPAVGIFETAHDFRFQNGFCAKTQTGGTR